MRITRSSQSPASAVTQGKHGAEANKQQHRNDKRLVHKKLPAAGANRCSAGPPQEHRKHHRSCSRPPPRSSHQDTPASDARPCSESRQPRPIFERIRAGGSSGRRSRAWLDTRGECSCDTHRTFRMQRWGRGEGEDTDKD